MSTWSTLSQCFAYPITHMQPFSKTISAFQTAFSIDPESLVMAKDPIAKSRWHKAASPFIFSPHILPTIKLVHHCDVHETSMTDVQLSLHFCYIVGLSSVLVVTDIRCPSFAVWPWSYTCVGNTSPGVFGSISCSGSANMSQGAMFISISLLLHMFWKQQAHFEIFVIFYLAAASTSFITSSGVSQSHGELSVLTVFSWKSASDAWSIILVR